jgi:BirA family transcriptional regulator, biotin operon repressor / biotin---[acetyl-CoA-carboxylase] ligase
LYKIPATTLFLGKRLIFMPECHSTNDVLLLLCQNEPAPEGTIIITANQTAGRGQRGNRWETEPGKNLTFSLLLKPGFLDIRKQFFLNILFSLGIRDYLTKSATSKVQIKWPNDIMLEEKKIGGVLIENQLIGTSINNTVVGIGLNINQQEFSITTATSLRVDAGHDFDLNEALERLLKDLEVRYLQLRALKEDVLLRDYLEHLYMKDRPFRFGDRDGDFEGVIRGIDSIGRLLVEKHGHINSYDLKEIRYVGHLV